MVGRVVMGLAVMSAVGAGSLTEVRAETSMAGMFVVSARGVRLGDSLTTGAAGTTGLVVNVTVVGTTAAVALKGRTANGDGGTAPGAMVAGNDRTGSAASAVRTGIGEARRAIVGSNGATRRAGATSGPARVLTGGVVAIVRTGVRVGSGIGRTAGAGTGDAMGSEEDPMAGLVPALVVGTETSAPSTIGPATRNAWTVRGRASLLKGAPGTRWRKALRLAVSARRLPLSG